MHVVTSNRASRVVIVEALSDARDVLCASLERRGLVAFPAAEANTGLELAEQHHADVIVFDAEAAAADDEAVQHRLAVQSRREQSDLVILGRARYLADVPPDRVISKPYHFGPLIHKIQEIVDLRRGVDRAAETRRAA